MLATIKPSQETFLLKQVSKFTVDDAVVGTTFETNFPKIPKSAPGIAARFLNHQESVPRRPGMFFMMKICLWIV